MEMILFNYSTVPVIVCGGEDSKVHLFTEKNEKVTVLVYITCKSNLFTHVFFLSPTVIFYPVRFFPFSTHRQFVKVQSLLGHEDWIRGVEFTMEG